MLLFPIDHEVKGWGGMSSSYLDKSRFLSHLSANNAVASKSRNLRRSRNYSSSHQFEVEVGASSPFTESGRESIDHKRQVTQQQKASHRSSCLQDEEKENIARSLERLRSSKNGIGE